MKLGGVPLIGECDDDKTVTDALANWSDMVVSLTEPSVVTIDALRSKAD